MKYTVILLICESDMWDASYVEHVEAVDPIEAVELARENVVRLFGYEDCLPEAFHTTFVFPGHHDDVAPKD